MGSSKRYLIYIYHYHITIISLSYHYYITDRLQKLIYCLGDPLICYDWTFRMGACTHDTIDFRTVQTQKLILKNEEQKEIENEDDANNDQDDEAENDNDEKKEDPKPGYNIRKLACKIDSSWLVLANSLDMIYGMHPTPG